jgi:hypothetical protein
LYIYNLLLFIPLYKIWCIVIILLNLWSPSFYRNNFVLTNLLTIIIVPNLNAHRAAAVPGASVFCSQFFLEKQLMIWRLICYMKKLPNNSCDINYTYCKKLFLKDCLIKCFYLILKKYYLILLSWNIHIILVFI